MADPAAAVGVSSRISAYSYVLPLRMATAGRETAELAEYLARLSQWCADIVVVDGSAPLVFAANHRLLARHARHVAVDPARRSLMGKVGGVLTGLDLARHERVVIADDDVRFDAAALERVVGLLTDHDLVRPQNYFSPRPWHALWDTGRILLNRAMGADYPGTLGVRRTIVMQDRGYDGDVLFENLELIRTVQARGGLVASPLDLFVCRQPPAAAHFWGQRTRQAYDDFALPARMAVWLSIVPALGACVARRRVAPAVVAAAVVMSVAETGRRRAGGNAVFPMISTLLAPLWMAERGVCAWLAVWQRLRFGGVRYGDSVIRTAAHSRRTLRRRGLGPSGSGRYAERQQRLVDRALGRSAGNHRPWPVPARPWVMAQSWVDLLFAHWSVPPEALNPVVPPQLQLETFEGKAWLTVTPFEVRNLRLRATPPVPFLCAFPEINVRTYVSFAGKPGIFFFSLDAGSRLAVAAARRFYRLPYFRACMSIERLADEVRYESRRSQRERPAPPAAFHGRYRATGRASAAADGTLEHWLTERYCLYTLDDHQQVLRGEIHHLPWSLQPAEAAVELNTMALQLGIELDDQPILHYAARQDVVFWSLEPASRRGDEAH